MSTPTMFSGRRRTQIQAQSILTTINDNDYYYKYL